VQDSPVLINLQNTVDACVCLLALHRMSSIGHGRDSTAVVSSPVEKVGSLHAVAAAATSIM